MDLLQYYNSINLEELNRFIEEGQEENISLEFKTANHPYNGNSISRDAETPL
jgi:hypothetical protein